MAKLVNDVVVSSKEHDEPIMRIELYFRIKDRRGSMVISLSGDGGVIGQRRMPSKLRPSLELGRCIRIGPYDLPLDWMQRDLSLVPALGGFIYSGGVGGVAMSVQEWQLLFEEWGVAEWDVIIP